jgi:hypothetical protein
MDVEMGVPTPGFKKPSLLIVGLAIPGLVVGFVAVGPIFPVIALATLLFLWAVLRLAPFLNDRLHGGPRRTGLLLSAPAVVDHVVGRCEIEPVGILWRPYGTNTGLEIATPVVEVEGVMLQPQRGPQPSSLALIRLSDGRTLSIRIFATAQAIAEAFHKTAGR